MRAGCVGESLEILQRYTRSVSFEDSLRFYKPPLAVACIEWLDGSFLIAFEMLTRPLSAVILKSSFPVPNKLSLTAPCHFD